MAPKPGSLPFPPRPIGFALPQEQHMLVYDSRSDGGPRYVGPFLTYVEALAHHDRLLLKNAVFDVVPVTHPDDDLNKEEH